VTLLFEILSAFLVFRIGSYITADKRVRYFFSILTLLMLFGSQGIWIVLEPFVTFFVLLSLFFFLKASRESLFYIYSGGCVALAFLCKQYGIACGVGLVLALLFDNRSLRQKITSFAFLVFGFCLPLLRISVSLSKSPFWNWLNSFLEKVMVTDL
jgi:4-amino-4-deoxy-L-arabinose transferase-like glycosyltransferase